MNQISTCNPYSHVRSCAIRIDSKRKTFKYFICICFSLIRFALSRQLFYYVVCCYIPCSFACLFLTLLIDNYAYRMYN